MKGPTQMTTTIVSATEDVPYLQRGKYWCLSPLLLTPFSSPHFRLANSSLRYTYSYKHLELTPIIDMMWNAD